MHGRPFKVHLGNRVCKRADVHGTNNKMIDSRNVSKFVLKLLAAKNHLAMSVLCFALFL